MYGPYGLLSQKGSPVLKANTGVEEAATLGIDLKEKSIQSAVETPTCIGETIGCKRTALRIVVWEFDDDYLLQQPPLLIPDLYDCIVTQTSQNLQLYWAHQRCLLNRPADLELPRQ